MKKFLLVLVIGVLWAIPSYGANACDVNSPGNCAGVNSSATGGGIHGSGYAITGFSEGQKNTFTLSSTALITLGSGAALPFISVCGSPTKLVQVKRLNINGSVATTAARVQIKVIKTFRDHGSSEDVANLSQAAHNTAYGIYPTALADFWSNYAIFSFVVGTIGIKIGNFPITATVAATNAIPELIWEFNGVESQSIILRGGQDCVAAGFAVAPATIPTVAGSITWTEEPYP